MSKPIVDVVIPALNRVELLREAIYSVLNQTHRELLLWVVDDASAESLEAQIAISDSRIKFLRLQKNQGPGIARNYGAACGTSQFLAFLDSDDLWHPDKLVHQIDYMEKHGNCAWVHTSEEWFRNEKLVLQRAEHRKEGGQFLERAFERCLISPSAVLFRRDFFSRHGGFAPHFFICEDYELWLRLLAVAPIGYIDMPLTIKRSGPWQQLSSVIEIDRYRILALHRFYRGIRNRRDMQHYLGPLLHEAEKKCAILLKGALKYNRKYRVRTYQAWLTLFKMRRTRVMR